MTTHDTPEAVLADDVLKFVRWCANVRSFDDDPTDVARALLHRMETAPARGIALREWVGLRAVRQGNLPAGSTVIDAEELDAHLAGLKEQITALRSRIDAAELEAVGATVAANILEGIDLTVDREDGKPRVRFAALDSKPWK
jgi:hypothetical protein